jgi:hypothetical protein
MKLREFKAPAETEDAKITAMSVARGAPRDAPRDSPRDGQTEALLGRGGASDAAVKAPDRTALEVALLKARIEHLELIVETARSLMGSNQERLLRRLYEVPRDITSLDAQLRHAEAREA